MKSFFKTYHYPIFPIVISFVLLVFTSCEDYLEAEDPVGQLNTTSVFNDENTATAAVTSLYGLLRDQVLLTGNSNGLGFLMGLYADEMDYYGTPGESTEHFYTHQITPANLMVKELWDNSYHLIYMCNAAIEGLENSENLTEETKAQLGGEALVVRAMVHFYLLNLFGDIPYIQTTDYEINTKVKRMPETAVYDALVTDLRNAKNLLGPDYPSGERIRANKWVASALLARIYLYMGQWQMAEEESSLLVNQQSVFILEPNPENVFLKNSSGAILQLKPKNEGDNTLEGATYIFTSPPPPFAALNNSLVENMDPIDLRKQYWIGEVSDGSNTWYFPYKYKQNLNTGTSLEYSIVLRIAEQFLIRAEARLMQGDLSGANDDLNRIRSRAGLDSITFSTSEAIFEALIKERNFELFSEFGHRWFDLKRWGLANSILAPIKPGWKASNILLPLPESELLLNPNLKPQNPGY
jgi:starch-binding outer membrane protein, SusD/RagB family